MARVQKEPESCVRAGLAPVYTTITVDNIALLNKAGNIIVHLISAHDAIVTITIAVAATVDGQAVAAKTVELAAAGAPGDEKFIGPFPTKFYNQEDAFVNIDASVADVVTIAAFLLVANQ